MLADTKRKHLNKNSDSFCCLFLKLSFQDSWMSFEFSLLLLQTKFCNNSSYFLVNVGITLHLIENKIQVTFSINKQREIIFLLFFQLDFAVLSTRRLGTEWHKWQLNKKAGTKQCIMIILKSNTL